MGPNAAGSLLVATGEAPATGGGDVFSLVVFLAGVAAFVGLILYFVHTREKKWKSEARETIALAGLIARRRGGSPQSPGRWEKDFM